MLPLANMIIKITDPHDIIPMLEKLEGRMGAGRQVTVVPGTFKVLERMYVPADFDRLLAEFMKDSAPATVAFFTATVTKLVKERNWTWLLLHPELQDKDIHPSRRVSALPCPSVGGTRNYASHVAVLHPLQWLWK